MGDYQRLQTDAEIAEIVAPVVTKTPRPGWHRALFAFSIAFTLGLVVFFLWGLPCDLQTCPDAQPLSWDQTLYGLELKGGMHLTGGHLVAILRVASWGRVAKGFLPRSGGVIALSATTGDTVWYIPFRGIVPIHIDCSVLGKRRCLILGESGFLMAIDYLSGMQVWKMTSSNTTVWPQPEGIDFPLLLPERKELISLSRFRSGSPRLVFVNMETGLITSEPRLSSECRHVFNLTYTPPSLLSPEAGGGFLNYTCLSTLGVSRVLSYQLGTRRSELERRGNGEPVDYSRKLLESGRVTGAHGLGGEGRISYTNKGSCPEHCQVTLTVTDWRNTTLWSYSAERTYAMAPLPLHFKPSRITGFLVKLWQWRDQGFKSASNNYTVELINERIVLITFDQPSSIHVVNASQTDITQLCYKGTNECQPQLSFQTQSALLVDTNGDGSQELISYFVTYRPGPGSEEEHNLQRVTDWELQSKVRLVRLEAELSKLYDAVSSH